MALGTSVRFVAHTRSRSTPRFKCMACGFTYSVPAHELRYRKQKSTTLVLGVAYLMQKGDFHVSRVAESAGVSRPTVYRWRREAMKHPDDLRAFEAKLTAAYTRRWTQLESQNAREGDFGRLALDRWTTPWKLVEEFEEAFKAAQGEERSALAELLHIASRALG